MKNKFTKQYKQHLKEVEAAQEAFEKNPTQETATHLSNLKNNLFKDPKEVFKKAYIKEETKDQEGDFELLIEYKKGTDYWKAKELKITEKEE